MFNNTQNLIILKFFINRVPVSSLDMVLRLFSHEAVELSETFHIIEVETVPLHSVPGCFVPARERGME